MNLTALHHSPLLQSLGWAIANSLWQSAALWITYYLINGSYRIASSKFKTNTATSLLFLGFIWFAYTFIDQYIFISNKINIVGTTEYYQSTSAVTSTLQWQLLLTKAATTLPYLSVAYLLLLMFLSFRLIASYRYTSFIKTNGLQKPAVEWKLFTERVSRHIGITKKIKLWVSHHIDVPATIGFLKPVILIPVASVNQLSAEQLEAIILHELSHIKSNDYLINIFISLIETILFFNPFIVLLAKIIKRERENCCDDFVIQYQYDRHSYASALLSLEQYRNTNMRLAISATSGKKQLLDRVKRIMEVKNSTSFNYGQKLLALILITGIICSLAWLSPGSNKNNQKLSKKENKINVKKPGSIKEVSPSLESIKSDPDVTWINATIAKAIKQPAVQKEIVNAEKITADLSEGEKENVGRQLMELLHLNEKLNNAESPLSTVKENGNAKGFHTFNFNSRELTAATLQKVQSAIKQANFKKLANNNTWQSEIKQPLMNVWKDYGSKVLLENMNAEEIEKLINTELKNVTHTFTRINTAKFATARAQAKCDSLSADKVFVMNTRKREKNNEYLDRGSIYTTGRLERRIPAPRPFIYNYNSNTPPAAMYMPAIEKGNKFKTTPDNDEDENHFEYKNGTVIINGKVVKIPDTEKILNEMKGKKLSIVSGDNVIEIQIKD